ncbi:hypothetical protein CLRAG_37630 [Clostridium ragsdalei P11]|uniref:DUF2971 domain-containing protein n=1 Tax=Clostridium ragsdalei P11 TaxID=1353534 RepID=A0A1A6AJA9_9CLOT|nr:DUF2971 domain-containing protein [Clostridium ragsdalei]OBR90156.1 hypothetical protein CLRAG_37630 [Clostridium ragsdalei P11]
MFYYRFRPSSELAIKELMYNEIYFASNKECNDPFDGKTFLAFEADKGKWRRLLELAWKNYNNPNKTRYEEQLSAYLTKISPLTYDEVLQLDYIKVLCSLQFPPDLITAFILDKQIKHFLDLYKPRNTYFVSFSRVCDEMLMWAHYASMHQGYCLIFKAIDNSLYQCHKHKRNSVGRNTQNGIAPKMSQAIPDSFPFEDISYSVDSTSNNAFYCFPQYVIGPEIDKRKQKDFLTWKRQQHLIKHNCWDYEQESRLTLSSPIPWLFGEVVECSQQERLFHYQPNQLVGIILGARMDAKQKMRIREIIKEHMDLIALNPGNNSAVFNFLLCQATLPHNQRKVVIKEEEIFTLTSTISRDDSDFERYLQEWKEGWAIVFNGSSGSRKKFL